MKEPGIPRLFLPSLLLKLESSNGAGDVQIKGHQRHSLDDLAVQPTPPMGELSVLGFLEDKDAGHSLRVSIPCSLRVHVSCFTSLLTRVLAGYRLIVNQRDAGSVHLRSVMAHRRQGGMRHDV